MADRLAGGNLDEIVAFHVNDDRNWTWIADRLRRDHGIEVTRVTLAKWYGHLLLEDHSPAEAAS